jgi:two-component system sensor histidine kinase KdpD
LPQRKAGVCLSGFHIPVRPILGRNHRRILALQWSTFVLGAVAVLAVILFALPAENRVVWSAVLVAFIIVVASSSILFSYRKTAEVQQPPTVSDLQNIYELIRQTLQMNLHAEPGARLAELVRETFSFEAVAIFDADLQELYKSGSWTASPVELAQNAYYFETVDDDPSTGVSRRVVRLGAVPVGSLIVRGEATPLAVSTIAALIAITFDRYHALANESRIEAERRAEQLRVAVLDNLAHAYKTPLTAIRAASSGLNEMGRLSAGQADLVSLIDEQASLLSDLTTRLLGSARLDHETEDNVSAGIDLKIAPVAVGPLMDEVVGGFSERSSRNNIVIDLVDDGMVVRCDRQLIAMLLTQYLDNAIKYSEALTKITLRAAHSGDEVVFSVHSFGPVIHAADRERLFERYFRSSSSPSQAEGTGIGLSIARKVAAAHGGTVWVASNESDGNTFYATIPSPKPPVDTQREAREAMMLQRSTQ